MIVRLQGRLLEKGVGTCIVDVNGVGYGLSVSMSTLGRLGEVGAVVTLWVYERWMLDGHSAVPTLYGFADEQERRMFLAVLNVSGVGARTALALLGGLGVDRLALAIANGDLKALSGVPGVGKKTAERLVVELRDKLAKGGFGGGGAGEVAPMLPGTIGGPLADVELALRDMGYGTAEIQRVIRELSRKSDGKAGPGAAESPPDLVGLIQRALNVLHGRSNPTT